MSPRAVAVVIASFFTIFIAYGIRYGYGMLLPSMLPGLGITKTAAGVIYSAYFLAYTLCSPPLGWLSDRYDVRIILTLFTGLLGAGAFLMAFATTVSGACAAFALVGIGHAACWAPVTALVQRWVPDEKRGTILSWTSMGSGFGVMTLSLVLPILVRDFSWRAGWMGMGLTGFCVALLNAVLVRRPPSLLVAEKQGGVQGKSEESFEKSKGLPEKPQETAEKSKGVPKKPEVTAEKSESVSEKPEGTKGKPERTGGKQPETGQPSLGMMPVTNGDLLRDRTLWRIGFSYLLVGVTVLGPYTFLGTYATDQLHLSYGVSVRLYAVIAVAGMTGKVFLGPLSDAVGRVRVMILCGLLLGLGCLGFASFENRIATYVFAAVFGIGFGSVWPIYAAAAPDFFPRRLSGSVIGIWTFFLGVGSILSPVVCGWAIDLTGGYGPAFMIGMVSALVSAGLLLPMDKTATQKARLMP